MLHIHREILELAANADVGPTMPPAAIEPAVRALIEQGLVAVETNVPTSTADRRALRA